MIDKDICFDLKAGRRRPALVMFNCLVLTKVEAEAGPGIDVPGIREALELESADTVGRANGRFDEETNLYLSNLLAAFSNPTRIEHLKTYLSAYDIGAFRRLARSADGTLRYSVYKTDRDFVLLSV